MNIKTFFNRIIVKPDEAITGIMGYTFSEDDISGTLHGDVVAVADNIDDIKVGDKLYYSPKVEKILIEDCEYHIIRYEHAYWTPESEDTQK